MAKELILYAYIPSESEYNFYYKKFRPFMVTYPSERAIKQGVLINKVGKYKANGKRLCPYALRTLAKVENEYPMICAGMEAGKLGKCLSSYDKLGLRVALQLKYDKNSSIVKSCKTHSQTTHVWDTKAQKNHEKDVAKITKLRKTIADRRKELERDEREISQLEDQYFYSQEKMLKRIIEKRRTKLAENRNQLSEDSKILKQGEKLLKQYKNAGIEIKGTAEIITFGGKEYIWLNKEDFKIGKAKTMLCWSLEALECAKPFSRNYEDKDFSDATEIHNQCKRIVLENCTEEEKAMLIPVKMSEEDNYESAQPLLSKRIDENEIEN